MNTSKESIDRIAAYYETYGPIFKKEGIDSSKPELYGMHIGYQGNNPEINESASKLMERKIIREADIDDRQQILDAGCGTGTLAFEIANLYPNTKVYGVDLLKEHLEIAGRYTTSFPNVFFSRQDYLNLDFRDSFFDRVLFCESLVHSQDKNKLLTEAHRILKPGGKIVIADVFMLKDNLTEKEKLDLSNFSEETGIPNFENLYIFIQQLQQLGFKNLALQDLTNSISSTITPKLEVDSPNLSTPSTENITLSKLENLLSTIGELYFKKNAGYFIITADVKKAG